jgi:hypothetical protein
LRDIIFIFDLENALCQIHGDSRRFHIVAPSWLRGATHEIHGNDAAKKNQEDAAGRWPGKMGPHHG